MKYKTIKCLEKLYRKKNLQDLELAKSARTWYQ